MASQPTGDASVYSICSRFEQTVERYPDQVAFKDEGGRGKEYRYRELRQTVRSIAGGLVNRSCIDERGIGILSENRPEWSLAYLSILAAGGTVAPLDINLKPTEIAYIVKHAGLGFVFTSDKGRQLLQEAQVDARLFCFDDDSSGGLTALAAASPLPSPRPPSQVAVIIYTSGTTGTPKAVELTHKNILSNLDGINQCLTFGADDVFLSVLPLHHTFEATCGFLTPLMSGATVVFARSLKSNQILEDITHNGVTLMVGVPLLFEKFHQTFQRKILSAPLYRRVMFHALLAASAAAWQVRLKAGRSLFRSVRERAGLGSVRMFVSGGAALPLRIARFFNLLGIDFIQGYGMTECSPVISVNRPAGIKFGSVGPPLPNVEVAIHDAEAGGVGEIVVRGDNVTPGYRGLPEESAKLIVDGWLHTGDLGRIRDDHLWITGRRKSLIVSAAGKNIYPEELEEKLMESPLVLEAVVFGRAREGRQGVEVRALIVPDSVKFDNIPPSDQLREMMARVVGEVNERVASYKRITAFDIQIDELEKTSTKKVKRFRYK